MCSVRTAIPFGSFVDLTSSIIRWDPKRDIFCTAAEKGKCILARRKSGGKPAIFNCQLVDTYLTAIYAVADNVGLFVGVPVSLLA